MKRFALLIACAGACDGGSMNADAGEHCASGAENTPAACSDGCSNDDDPAIDCGDVDCRGVGECRGDDGGRPIDAGRDAGPPPIDAGPDCVVLTDGTRCGEAGEIC